MRGFSITVVFLRHRLFYSVCYLLAFVYFDFMQFKLHLNQNIRIIIFVGWLLYVMILGVSYKTLCFCDAVEQDIYFKNNFTLTYHDDDDCLVNAALSTVSQLCAAVGFLTSYPGHY